MVNSSLRSRCRTRFAALAIVLTLAASVRPVYARQVLLVANHNAQTVAEYDGTTGAMVTPNLLAGSVIDYPTALTLGHNNQLYVSSTLQSAGDDSGVSIFNASTGAPIKRPLVILNTTQQFYPDALALDDNGYLLVANAYSATSGPLGYAICRYNASTGSAAGLPFISGLSDPTAIVLDGRNHLFVANSGNNTVGEYDATTGAAINPAFITGLNVPGGLALDSLNHLLVTNIGGGTVGEYDATTGAAVNPMFISGLNEPYPIALDGSSHVFVANYGNNAVGEYDATTGATINANFITGLNTPVALLYVPVPEPSSLLLVAGAAASGVGMWRRRRKCT